MTLLWLFSILVALIWLAPLTLLMRRYLHILQLEEYEARRLLRWARSAQTQTIRPWRLLALGLAVALIVASLASLTLLAVLLLALWLFPAALLLNALRLQPAKKRLVYTARVRRLIDKAVRSILQRQLPDGGFNIYPQGPADISATIKAYFSLKLAGVEYEDSRLVKARDLILGLGEMRLKRLLQSRIGRLLDHFGKRFEDLLFSIVNVAQRVHEADVEPEGVGVLEAHRHAAGAGAGMQGRMAVVGRLETTAGRVSLRMSAGVHSGILQLDDETTEGIDKQILATVVASTPLSSPSFALSQTSSVQPGYTVDS